MTEISLFLVSPYLFLFSAVVFSLWGRKEQFVAFSLALGVIFAFLTEVIGWQGVVLMAIMPISLFIWINHFFADFLRKLGFLVFLFSGFILVSHSLPDINNLKIFDQLVFSENSSPFDLYLNFDKVFLATVIFVLLPAMEKTTPFRASVFTVFKYFAVALVFVMPVAILSGYIHYEINLNPYVILWALNNLFFVCFAEEVIFRRFIQNQLVHYFRNTQYGDLLAIALGALVFGLAHYSGGFLYVGLASLAGIFYGLCFYHTCNVRSSMAVHFMLNLAHALFFTYPFAS